MDQTQEHIPNVNSSKIIDTLMNKLRSRGDKLCIDITCIAIVVGLALVTYVELSKTMA